MFLILQWKFSLKINCIKINLMVQFKKAKLHINEHEKAAQKR